MMAATPARSTPEQPRRRIRLRLLKTCCALWMSGCLLLMQGAEATITIVSTGTRYNCRQDKALGKQLWRGYEYMAALQFVPGNLPLCPPPSSSFSSSLSDPTSSISGGSHRIDLGKVPAPYANITVPDDGLPVALLVRSGTGCTLQDKIEFALTRVQPAGLVRYLLVDDAAEETDAIVVAMKDHPEKAVEFDAVVARPGVPHDAPSSLRPSRVETVSVIDDGGNDVPLYILYISAKTQFELLDYLLKLDPATVASGGPRISLDSRTADGWWDGEGAIWIALSALLSACACSFLLIAGGTANGWWQPEEDHHHQAPSRPQRRRLTREQVKRMLPHWRFNGTSLQAIAGEGVGMAPLLERDAEEEGGGGTAGLVAAPASGEASRDSPATADALIPPQPLELSLCSICLDDYEAGDKLRVLPCNHAFHGKCIGKWLVERSATCPLCKTELWDGEAEEDDEEGESDDRRAAAAAAPPPSPPRDYGANSWDRAWHRFFTNDAYQYIQQSEQPPQATTTLPLHQPPGLRRPEEENNPYLGAAEVATSTPSVWRRMWSSSRRRLARHVHLISSSDHGRGGASTSSMLTEPLLEHSSSERENGAELRTLSPRRGPSSSSSPPPPSPDDATRIQPSREGGGGRLDPLALADPTAASTTACTSSPAVPAASSSPPRQVSV